MADDVIRLVTKPERAAATEEEQRAAEQAELLLVLEAMESRIVETQAVAIAVVLVNGDGTLDFEAYAGADPIRHLALIDALSGARQQIASAFLDDDDE